MNILPARAAAALYSNLYGRLSPPASCTYSAAQFWPPPAHPPGFPAAGPKGAVMDAAAWVGRKSEKAVRTALAISWPVNRSITTADAQWA